MDIRQIRYALSVAKERSFTKASLTLNISQSAVSEQVKLLEAQIGFDLFRRTGRGVEPTDHGRVFLAEAERVASDLLNLAEVARRIRGFGADCLRIGIGSGLAANLLPRVFRENRISVETHVEIRTAPTRVIFEELRAERIDIGILVEARPDPVAAGLTVVRLQEVEMIAIAAPGARLPLCEERLDLARLGGIPVVMSELSIGYGQVVGALFNDLGVRPPMRAIADNIETMKVLVASGVGVALVPAGCADCEIACGRLEAMPTFPSLRVGVDACMAPHSLSRRKQALVSGLLRGLSRTPETGDSK